MKYGAEIVNKAIHAVSDKLRKDPAMIRRRMDGETETKRSIHAFCENMAYDKNITDEGTIETLLSCALYGFFLREEIAVAYSASKKEV